MTEEKRMHLRVHVFGPGVGESIAIQYPNNSDGKYCWGLIDCYSEHIVHFLRDVHGVKELEFVCWTHPHADHHDGFPALLNSYGNQIKRFWRFGGHNAEMLLTFHKLWAKNKPKLAKSELSKIQAIFDFALEKKESDPDSYKMLTDIHQSMFQVKYNKKCYFRISTLSPSSSLAEEYTSHIAKCMDDPSSPDWEAFNGAHNSISVVLFAEFGKTRLLFGADAEQKVWDEIFKSQERKNIKLSLCSNFVKISHHGSEGAYHKNSWIEISQKKRPHAVITPFTRSHLPNNKGIVLLKKHCKNIYLTATRKNYRYYSKAKSTSAKIRLKWKTYKPNTEYCTFEFDNKGNLTETSISNTAVVF